MLCFKETKFSFQEHFCKKLLFVFFQSLLGEAAKFAHPEHFRSMKDYEFVLNSVRHSLKEFYQNECDVNEK